MIIQVHNDTMYYLAPNMGDKEPSILLGIKEPEHSF